MPKTYSVIVALLLLMTMHSARSQGQTQHLGDELIRAYAGLESYCDSGFYVTPSSPAAGPPRDFDRCVHQDGRYKAVIQTRNSSRDISVSWSDGQREFVFDGYYDPGLTARSYDEKPISKNSVDDISPAVRTILGGFGIVEAGGPPLREELNTYVSAPELSRDGLVAYQSTRPVGDSYHIVWLSRADGLIRKFRWGRETDAGIDVTEVRVDEALSRSDVWFDAPRQSRVGFAMVHHPATSAALLSVISYFLGWIFWRISADATLDDDDRRERRGEMWRRFGKILGVIGMVATIVTAAVLAIGRRGGGDMPLAILLVPAGVLCLLVLWLAVCFLSARHLADTSKKSVPAARHRAPRKEH